MAKIVRTTEFAKERTDSRVYFLNNLKDIDIEPKVTKARKGTTLYFEYTPRVLNDVPVPDQF